MSDRDETEVLEGEVSNLVYECWVAEDRGSFNRLKSDDKLSLVSWLINSLDQHARPGAHIHIVTHGEWEYDPADDHIMNYSFDNPDPRDLDVNPGTHE